MVSIRLLSKAALEAEAGTLLTEIQRIACRCYVEGQCSCHCNLAPAQEIGFGRNGGALEIKVDDIDFTYSE
jgi:hypothetical protein